MESRFAQEIYFDTVQLPNGIQQNPTFATNNVSEGDDIWEEEGSYQNDSVARLDDSSDLDREWQRRHDQFFTIGYRDGLIAGKEASAQEGFNVGYKQSIAVGYDWGLVRGVTSALAFLPDALRDKLNDALEKRDEYRHLYESVHSLSTSDALKMFSDEIFSGGNGRNDEDSMAEHQVNLPSQSSEPNRIGAYVGKLKKLLAESPAIEVHLDAASSSSSSHAM